jgi:molybdopterin/thiamine biosynthesis adenylyltransferase
VHRYVFPEAKLRELREQLFAFSPSEAAAVLLCGRSMHAMDVSFFVREVVLVPPEECIAQDRYQVVIKPSFLAPLIKRARLEGWSLLFVHTHPFGDEVRFSPYDDQGESVLMPSVFARAGERPHGTLVVGRTGFDARFRRNPDDLAETVSLVVECGQDVYFQHRDGTKTECIEEQFDRSVRAFGADGQRVLSAMTVGIVGAGGIGSIVAQELAHLGVGRLLLLDHDTLEVTNLNRVVGAVPADVGRPKVEVLADHLRQIQPSKRTDTFQGNVLLRRDTERLLGTDFVFCCTDSYGSRAVLNQLAYQYLIPTIDLGVAIHVSDGRVENVSGRVQMLAPGLPCLVCQNFLNAEEVRRDLLTDEERKRDPYIVGMREPQPAVISLNAIVASLGVTMMLSAVTGLPSPSRHQVYSAERGAVRAVGSRPNPGCVICSLAGAFARGDLWPLPGRVQ